MPEEDIPSGCVLYIYIYICVCVHYMIHDYIMIPTCCLRPISGFFYFYGTPIRYLLWNQRWQLSRLFVPFKALGHCRHLSPALREDEPSMASIGLPFGPSVITHMAIENILFIDDFPIEISIQLGVVPANHV